MKNWLFPIIRPGKQVNLFLARKKNVRGEPWNGEKSLENVRAMKIPGKDEK
jgi:hypothetical protein